MDLLYNYPFASVLVSTLTRQEYHYGSDIETISKITNDAKKEITDHLIERVNLWMFPSEEHMLTYIEEKKAYYEGKMEIKFHYHK